MPLSPPPQDEQSRDHWYWRPGWGVGVRCYTFHVTFGAQPGRRALVEAVRALAPVRELPGWDAIPERWLHLTVQGVGFTTEVGPTDLGRVIAQAQRELAPLAPMELEVGPPLVDAEGVNLPVAHPDLDRVRMGLRDAVERVLGTVEEDEAWRPHVSVAYANTSGSPLAPVRALLERVPVRAAVAVDHVSLLELHRDEGVYVWGQKARIPLVGA